MVFKFLSSYILQFFSIYMKWEDKRHIKGNEGRIESCKSKHVEWDREGQFWLPRLDVWDAIELVRWSTVPTKET